MKKITLSLITLIASLAINLSCSSDDPWSDDNGSSYYDNNGNSSNGSISSSNSSSSELTSFAVAIDKTSAEPETTVDEYFPDAEDDLSANVFPTDVNITFNGSEASVDEVSGVTITKDGAHIVADHGSTSGIRYIVSGSTNEGSLTIIGDKKYELDLNGVSITNPDSAAINLLSKKRAFIVLTDGTSNYLADGADSKADDQKAAFYCKGKMLFNGSGYLEVTANYDNGIQCADYIVFRKGNNVYVNSSAAHGIKANDGIFINGGIINVEVSARAAKGITCESNIIVNGGRTTAITTGNGTYDTEDQELKGAAALKADSIITVNGGELWLKSTGAGGKGMRAGYEAYINGGNIYVITEGSKFTYGSDKVSPKGIKAGYKTTTNNKTTTYGVLNITGGTIMVRTNGTNGEGIESKGTIDITGGTVQVAAYDDAINSTGNMTITAGDITVVGRNSDGLDANGDMYIKGGTIVAFGASGAESGIDVGEQNRLYISGGSIFGIGGRTDASLGSTSQGIATTTASVSANSTVTISNSGSTLATFNMPPYSYNSGTLMVSAPGMSSGSTYTLTLGSSSKSVTASSTISGNNYKHNN